MQLETPHAVKMAIAIWTHISKGLMMKIRL